MRDDDEGNENGSDDNDDQMTLYSDYNDIQMPLHSNIDDNDDQMSLHSYNNDDKISLYDYNNEDKVSSYNDDVPSTCFCICSWSSPRSKFTKPSLAYWEGQKKAWFVGSPSVGSFVVITINRLSAKPYLTIKYKNNNMYHRIHLGSLMEIIIIIYNHHHHYHHQH